MRKMSRAGQVSRFIFVYFTSSLDQSDIGNLLQQSDISRIYEVYPLQGYSQICNFMANTELEWVTWHRTSRWSATEQGA